MEGQSVPYARASQLLQDLLSVHLSTGSIARFVTTGYEHLAEVEAQIKAALVKAQVLHQDETGLRIGTEGWWVHVCATDRLTHYAAHASRGRAGMDAIGIAPQFRGTSVYDALVSYEGYSFTPALCNMHHLRELTFIEEVLEQGWAKKMKDLLLEMKAEVEQAKGAGKQHLDVPLLARLLRRYDELLAEGYRANPPPPPPQKSAQGKRKPGKPKQSPVRNLLDRFSQKKQAVLRFLHDFAVPFDNNQAERDLRMIKVQQKISGCFRSQQGIAMFCRTRSYLSTLRKQGIPCFWPSRIPCQVIRLSRPCDLIVHLREARVCLFSISLQFRTLCSSLMAQRSGPNRLKETEKLSKIASSHTQWSWKSTEGVAGSYETAGVK